jgi:hypothetical protein
MKREQFKKLPAPPGHGTHLLCDADRMKFRSVQTAPAVNAFPPEAFVRVKPFPRKRRQLNTGGEHSIALIFLQTEPLRLET